MPLPTSLKRSIALALDNMIRNKWLTIATILIMGIILFIFNVIFTVNLLAQESIKNLKGQVDLILYLKDDADTLSINRLIDNLEENPDIKTIHYTSKEEALDELLKKYGDAVNPFMNYDLENPLPGSIQIVATSPEKHEAILKAIQNSNDKEVFLSITAQAENQALSEQLIGITTFSQKLLLGILLAFVLGSGLVIANTIHINLFQRKKEVEIMKLVGAKPNFIRAPFMIEGIFYGTAAATLATILLIIFTKTINLNSTELVQVDIHFGKLLILEILVATTIGIMSSLIALHPLLKRQSA